MAQAKGSRFLGVYAAIMVAFLLLPVLIVIPSAFSADTSLSFPPHGFSLRWFANIWSRRAFADAFRLSTELAVLATLLALILGVPAALALTRFRFPGRQAVLLLFLTPLVFPSIVLAVALAMVMSQFGLLRSFAGLLIAHVLITLPYIVRTAVATLTDLDVAFEEAAATLGANPWRRFTSVTLPLLRPGLVAGATFSVIISFDEFTVSLFQVGPGLTTLPIEMFNYTESSVDPTIAAISAILIVLTGLAVLVIERVAGFGGRIV